MTKPRFLLDEHIDRAIQRQLRRWDLRIEVLAVGDPGAPPPGASDAMILGWIEQTGNILVTENRRTVPRHLTEHFAAGRHVPGVFWLRPAAEIGSVIESLYLIWLTSAAEEYQDCALYIPL